MFSFEITGYYLIFAYKYLIGMSLNRIFTLYQCFFLLDISSSVGLMLMKWVYTDQAEIPHDEAFLIELVKAAKKYRLKELKER